MLIWGMGAVLLTSPSLFTFDSRLGFAPRSAGTYKQQRQENWVNNTFGELGMEVHELSRLHSAKPKCVIYGDSYMEAAMIPGGKRVQDLFQCNDLDMVSMGYSSISAPEYCFLLKRVPAVIGNVRYNVVFVGDVYDFVGMSPELCDGNFVGSLPQKSSSGSDKVSSEYRLFSLRAVMRRWRLCKFDWFGNHWIGKEVAAKAEAKTDVNLICRKLKEAVQSRAEQSRAEQSRAEVSLLIAYAPTVPRIYNNQVRFDAEAGNFGRELAAACKSNGIAFLDLGEAFCDYYRRSGRFPRGFFNTPPGEGHLNEAGHAIAAQMLSAYFREVR